jgi:hypothetical protein
LRPGVPIDRDHLFRGIATGLWTEVTGAVVFYRGNRVTAYMRASPDRKHTTGAPTVLNPEEQPQEAKGLPHGASDDGEPQRAHRRCVVDPSRHLVKRFEWHYTPKHGSWLDLAESELGVLSSQCLDRRIPDKATLMDEIAAWERDRNANHTKASWHFTTPSARV